MELLAPAGTFDCVLTAVDSGADAVYFAGQEFGARSFAGNLTDEEIYRAADYCHLRGVRAYVTVNTLLYDKEYKDLEKFIRTLTLAGVDAVIVQDLGVLRLVRELSPDIELHASTQMTVHSADGVRELERLGVSRVVLSRELSGEEIRKIISSTKAEAEVFVHGAMCMSYSGQCLMSSIIGGRSGNRGRCAQPCRLPYSDGDKTKYYLSLKDMMLAEHIRSLEDMGVASLKIEGRMKGEAYVASVVSTYRRLIDEKRMPTRGEIDDLNRIFFRGGFTDKYFTGSIGPDMFAFDKPDNPYLKNDGKRAEKPKERRIKTELYARLCEGELPYISMKCQGALAEVTGESAVQTAIGRPLTEESVRERLSKTGGTAFEISDAKIELSGAPFVPASAIN
ncbi:MAG: U32 family peptidase, partial [Clostridia bacterium]|nr:U32 family peptidase [Clostridia bacterium]